MIQRIQTVWLLLAAICTFSSLTLSFYSGTIANSTSVSFVNGLTSFPISFVTIVIGVLTSVSVFLYNNRLLQMRLCVFSMILEGVLIFLYFNETKKYAVGTLSLTSTLQALVFLFVLLAFRGIYNDHKTVKESNRLR
jgi:hypothetical protein